MHAGTRVAIAALLTLFALAGCDASAAGPSELEATPTSAELWDALNREPGAVPGPPGPAAILALADELGLSTAQRASIQAIAEELRVRNEPLWEELRGRRPSGGPSSGGPPSGGPQRGGVLGNSVMEAIRANTLAALEEALGHLTEDQVRQFHDLYRNREGRPGLGEHGLPPAPGAVLAEVLGELDLTAEQRARIDVILERLREVNQPILAELRREGLGGPGTGGGWDPNDPRIQEVKRNLDEAMAAIEDVLSPDQWETFLRRIAERRSPPSGPRRP